MTAKIKRPTSSTKNYKYKPRGISPGAFAKVYWPYLPIVAAVTLLLSFGSSSSAFSSALRHPTGRVLDYATSMSANGLLSNTNAKRVSSGKSSLQLNDKLMAAAQAKANDMATRNYWSHNTPEGNPPWVFVSAQGYSYQRLGENLAAGFIDEQSTISGWIASPPHLENLIKASYSEVGFGFANNADYTSAGGGPMTIVVALYGQPSVAAASQTAPSAQPTLQAAVPSTAPVPAATPPPAPPAEQIPTNQINSSAPTSTATASENEKKGITLALRTTRAQLAFAELPMSGLATGLATLGLVLVLALWISRHFIVLRRAFFKSEKFAIKHPLVDIGLLIIAALLFLLIGTAGYIQ